MPFTVKNQPGGLAILDAVGDPVGGVNSNMPRLLASGNNAAAASGVMLSTPIFLKAGKLVTNITFVSGGTAATGPTNWWFALYSAAATPALLGQTANQLTAAFAADTVFTKALAAPVAITVDGYYWVSFMMTVSTTMPTLTGAAPPRAGAAGALVTGQPALAVTSGSGLTTTAPATIATPTTVATVPLVVVS